MLAAMIVNVALEAAGSAPSRLNEPVKSEKRPRTFATIAWRAWKPIVVCPGSISQVPVVVDRSLVMVVLSLGGCVPWYRDAGSSEVKCSTKSIGWRMCAQRDVVVRPES